MATMVTFTTCKEIHFVECIWTFDKYLKEGGTLEKEKTLKRSKPWNFPGSSSAALNAKYS